jgi:hypothetical protein
LAYHFSAVDLKSQDMITESKFSNLQLFYFPIMDESESPQLVSKDTVVIPFKYLDDLYYLNEQSKPIPFVNIESSDLINGKCSLTIPNYDFYPSSISPDLNENAYHISLKNDGTYLSIRFLDSNKQRYCDKVTLNWKYSFMENMAKKCHSAKQLISTIFYFDWETDANGNAYIEKVWKK